MDKTCSLEEFKEIKKRDKRKADPSFPLSFVKELYRNKKISPLAKNIWRALYDYSVYYDNNLMSINFLANEMDEEKENVRQAIKQLKKYKYVKTNLSDNGADIIRYYLK